MPHVHRPRPRERLAQHGADALSEAELVALLLGTGAKNDPAEALAERILHAVGGLCGVERLGAGRLTQLPGMGPAKAGRLLAAIELGRRVMTTPLRRGARIVSSRDVDAAMRPRLGRTERERFLAIPLDTRHRVIGEIQIAVGGLNACSVAPADVFRALLREASAAVVFVHNHPSGEPAPSEEDMALTERLCRAGELLGVPVLDHVIVGHEGYFSFLDEGLLAA